MQADDIQEKKREVTVTGLSKTPEIVRDVVNEVRVRATVVMTAIENQSAVHYAMPVRVMAGDSGFYYEQWKKTAQEHKEKNDLRKEEYLSGFAKADKLIPSITIVLYFGEEEWDGPRTLKEMMVQDEFPPEIWEFVSDYRMYLMEVRKWEDLENFQTDIRYVFGYLQHTSNKEELEKYLNENREAFEHMREDAYDFMIQMSHSKELEAMKAKYQNPKGEVNMCKAIQEMIESGRKEGEKAGEERGYRNGEKAGEERGRKNGYLIAGAFMKKRAEGKTDEEIARECGEPVEDVKMFFAAMA